MIRQFIVGAQKDTGQDPGPVLAGGAVEQDTAVIVHTGVDAVPDPVGVQGGPADIDLVPGEGTLRQVFLFKRLRTAGQGKTPVPEGAVQTAGPPRRLRIAPQIEAGSQTVFPQPLDSGIGNPAGRFAAEEDAIARHAAVTGKSA